MEKIIVIYKINTAELKSIQGGSYLGIKQSDMNWICIWVL
jgi:hypothetical protein